MRVACLIVALCGWFLGEETPLPLMDPAAVQDAQRAAALFHQSMSTAHQTTDEQKALQALVQTLKEQGAVASYDGERSAVAPVLGLPVASSTGIMKELSDVLIESTLSEGNLKKAPDPAAAVTVGPEISNPTDVSLTHMPLTVVVFWSMDSRNDGLAGKINRLVKARPDLTVYDAHLCPLKVWYSRINQTKKHFDRIRLESAKLMGDPMGLKRKRDEMLSIAEEWRGFTDMVNYRRSGGYAIVDDTRLAKAFHVDQVPSLRYVTHQGVVHRIDGIADDIELTTWCSRVEAWESENLVGELNRVFP